MKFLFLKPATLIFFSMFLRVTFVVSGTITQTITFDVTELQISQLNNYDKLLVSGCEITSQVGQPQLPVRVVHLAIPIQSEVTDIEIIGTESQYLDGPYLLYPVQPPQILSLRDQEIQFVEPDPATYSSPGPYPQKLVEYAGRGYFGEHNLASFLVYPVQYFPAQKKLLFHSEIQFAVHYAFNNQVPLPVSRSATRSEKFHQNLIKSLILNKEETSQISPGAERIRSELPEGDYKYVIITSPALESSFLPLAQWKTQKGVPTKIVNTTWIYTHYLTGDHQEKLRNFVLDAYHNWGTRWVLLGGDTGVIPERRTFAMDCEAGFYPDENEIPCDLYYAALDGNWNANGNNTFGEVDDEVDLLPEIFVGRAPVSNSTQAQVFVNKILTYEKNPPPDYLLKMLFAAELLWTNPYTDQGIAKDAIEAAYIPARFQISKLYESLGNESPSSVINAMNEGRHIINHDGHASESVMGVGTGYLSRTDMDVLRNGTCYSLLYSIGCYPASFDKDCIAEHFVNNANGGGVAFIGNSRYGWGSPGNPGYGYSDRFDNRFYQALFKDDIFNIGATLTLSKAFFAPYSRQENVYRWCMYEINLLGDPEMPIWTDVPQNLTVHHPTVVPVGTSSFSVTVTDDSLPIENALVCLMKGEEVYEYGYTDASGQITFTIAPTSPVEAMAVTVTAHNYLPYEGTCQVISDGPYVARTERITIDDSKGNNDGDINPGEEIYLSLELKNYGNQEANGITTLLRSADSMVTITDSTCFYGDIPAAGVSQNYDQFSFMINSGCQNGHVLYFNLEVTAADTHRWGDMLGLTVATPILAYSHHTAADGGSANPNHLPEPGETINLKVAVKNQGLGVAYDVTANLSSADSNLSFIQNNGHFGD
ncbi:MAG: C25 family cysteine peptidase, partial [candidate division KSB1 bacterium]|nr:C25 family cysteine peptidase [candidate division KSB1 bacterium]